MSGPALSIGFHSDREGLLE
jgi:hypothetical protein